MSNTFRSLRVRNYRLFFSGQLISISGTWMQQIAQDWLVLHLSNSGTAVGITTGLQFLPMLLFGMVGGIVADRFDKRRVLLATQALSGLLALTMGVLIATGVVQLWHVYVLAVLLGLVTAIDNPTRQSFVTEMVGPDEVTNAVGLNSAVFNVGRIVGPAVAALLIEFVGLSPAFFVNAASYVAVIAGLWLMDPAALFRSSSPAPRGKGQVREGFRYIWATPELRSTLLLLGVVATFGMNLQVVLPLLAKFTFHGGAGLYGVLMSLMAAGALVGALFAASRSRPDPRVRVGFAVAYGFLAVLTALAPTVWLTALLLVPTGGAAIGYMAMSNSTMQLFSEARMRGRVMAVYALVFLGSTPFGGPLTGWISQATSPRVGLAYGGVLTLLAGLVAWSRLPSAAPAAPAADPVFVRARRGIPRVAFWR